MVEIFSGEEATRRIKAGLMHTYSSSPGRYQNPEAVEAKRKRIAAAMDQLDRGYRKFQALAKKRAVPGNFEAALDFVDKLTQIFGSADELWNPLDRSAYSVRFTVVEGEKVFIPVTLPAREVTKGMAFAYSLNFERHVFEVLDLVVNDEQQIYQAAIKVWSSEKTRLFQATPRFEAVTLRFQSEETAPQPSARSK